MRGAHKDWSNEIGQDGRVRTAVHVQPELQICKRVASQQNGGLLPGFDVQMCIPEEDTVEVKDCAGEVHQGSSLENLRSRRMASKRTGCYFKPALPCDSSTRKRRRAKIVRVQNQIKQLALRATLAVSTRGPQLL
jgi:hypothetical protein